VWYLDTSAFLKLVVAEDESTAMRSWFETGGPCWSSQLLATEALRAGERLGMNLEAMEQALDTVSLVLPSVTTFRTAGRLSPSDLRALDALHIATALEMGDDLNGVVTYDTRMIEGARSSSIEVLTPT